MEQHNPTSSLLWLSDKQYALHFDESLLSAEPPSAQIDVTDPLNSQSWSITLNEALLRSLANEDLPRKFAAFFKLVKTALLLEKDSTAFSYNFGTDAEKQEGIRGKQEAVAGDSIYITISWTPFEDPIVFTLVLPQVSPPQVQLEGDIPAGTLAVIAEIKRRNEDLVKENEVNKSKIEMLNAEVDELRGAVTLLKRDHEELLNVIAGSWKVWLQKTPAAEVGKLRSDLIALKEGKKSQALKVIFEPLEAQVAGMDRGASFHSELLALPLPPRRPVETSQLPASPFQVSQIVDKSQQQKLNAWYGTPQQKWKLLYRGSEHGFTADSFHQHCDNKGPTMVIVKSTDNDIFGGYASISWARPGGYSAAAGSFVYTLVNSSGTAAKFDLIAATKQDIALFFHPGYGPTFGRGHDLHISNSCHQNSVSHSKLGGSYSGSGVQPHLFVGRQNFKVAEYEVFGFA